MQPLGWSSFYYLIVHVLKTCHFKFRRGCAYRLTQNLVLEFVGKACNFFTSPVEFSTCRDRVTFTFRIERAGFLQNILVSKVAIRHQCPLTFLSPLQMTASLGWAAAHPRPPWAASWMTSSGTRSSLNGSASRWTSRWTSPHSTSGPRARRMP